MLTLFDLCDLYAVLINIRRTPAYTYNQDIVDAILRLLTSQKEISPNPIRHAIKNLQAPLSEEYEFVHAENVYSYIPFLIKKEIHMQILAYAFEYLSSVIRSGNQCWIEDTADALHNLPLLMSLPKKEWRIFRKQIIVPYRKRWDKHFFREYEKEFC